MWFVIIPGLVSDHCSFPASRCHSFASHLQNVTSLLSFHTSPSIYWLCIRPRFPSVSFANFTSSRLVPSSFLPLYFEIASLSRNIQILVAKIATRWHSWKLLKKALKYLCNFEQNLVWEKLFSKRYLELCDYSVCKISLLWETNFDFVKNSTNFALNKFRRKLLTNRCGATSYSYLFWED